MTARQRTHPALGPTALEMDRLAQYLTFISGRMWRLAYHRVHVSCDCGLGAHSWVEWYTTDGVWEVMSEQEYHQLEKVKERTA